MNGYIYFLTNKSMPNLVKIGFTGKSVESRASALFGTNIPTPFDIIAKFYVSEPETVEKNIHKKLSHIRETKEREFFSGQVREILKQCISIIIEAIPNQTDVITQPEIIPKDLFSNIGVILLKELVNNRNGCMMYEFEENSDLNHHSLVIERELELLKNDGYIEFFRNTQKWVITGKGITKMFETSLILENELDKPHTWRLDIESI